MAAPNPAHTPDRLRPVIDDCRPILARQGMDAVQQRLVDNGMSTVEAIWVTMQLLDAGLREATDIVCASPARSQPTE